LDRDKYFCTRSVLDTGEILLKTQVWEIGLDKEGILNLMEIPHFECSLEINYCVNLLLNCIHGGILWIDPLVSIDIALIACIIGLSKS